MTLSRVREYLRGSLWFIPALGVIGAAVLAVVLTALDRSLEAEAPFLFSGGPDSARTFLSTIAASMITFMGLVFSITIVVLQLASQQFSPRVLRTFLRDRHSQSSLAVFVATFAFAVLVLREVRSVEGGEGEGFVPRLAITATFLLVLLSLAVFVFYIHHIAQSVRAATLVDLVGDETREVIDRLYPREAEDRTRAFPPGESPAREIRWRRRPGVITEVSTGALVREARRADCLLELVPGVGDFLPEGSPVFRVHGDPGALREDEVLDQVAVARERTMQQDVGFGLRQLVDMAIRALSPAVNDPTTAVQAIDQLHDLLLRLGTRAFPPGEATDEDGRVRLIFPTTTWEAYVSLAVDEIRILGGSQLQVTRRLRSMLEDLQERVPAHRRAPVQQELELLDAALEKTFHLQEDRLRAARPDRRGIGGVP